LEAAKKGIITDEIKIAAEQENLSVKELMELIAKGEVIITKNKNHKNIKIVAIGNKTKTKINANIGTSEDICDIDLELKKLKICIEAGADTVMDLSTGGNLKEIREKIIQNSTIPVGTVPIYETIVNLARKRQSINKLVADDIFNVIEEQAQQGVDFITVHCGVNKKSVETLIAQGRLLDVVSRGGAFLTSYIIQTKKENPLFEQFDRLLEIAYKFDLTLSLGDGMRPGCIADATDKPQIQELITLGELAKRAYEKNVQVMIEGPGHIPINQIATNIQLEKRFCNNAPFYVLGPIVTDIAPGYDHITSAIGGALAAFYGANFLCYVTPAEHLKLPDINEVKEGIIASRIAAHAADIAKGIPFAVNWDNEMANARKNLDWEKQINLAIDVEKAKELRQKATPSTKDVCTMCGEFCAIKELKDILKK
jgi:phosphomethylpyrimidine synthase